MVTLMLNLKDRQADPDATLTVPLHTIDDIILSVANRAARNRTALWQKKHSGTEAGINTRDRAAYIEALNWEILQHYRIGLSTNSLSADRPVIASI